MTFVDDLQKDSLPFLADEAATASLLKRILLFLEDEEFIQADLYCEKVLDTEPENPLAYLYKLMASRRISSLKDLASAQYIIDNDSSYKKAVRFAPEQMQLHLHQLNMHIYAGSIKACRSRAKIHLAHGELKETAQQYHNAIKMWEDSHETLPNAETIYSDLSNEISDFNWKLLLHNRQCPNDEELIARNIPIDNDRWYLSAVKWAEAEKKAYFTSVAQRTLMGAHLKCLDYIKTKQTRLARIWTDHYKAAASADDPLVSIHQALVDTDGFTKFSADAPAAMLKLIRLYKTSNPQLADELKAILQDYYARIFRFLLDFTGKEPQKTAAPTRLDADSYAIMIAQQEASACAPGGAAIPVPDFTTPTESFTTDPIWAIETARLITGQMADAVSDDLSPYSAVTTYLIAAKGLTIRYGKKDGIVTEPPLFKFICQYYADAIASAQQDQVAAIQTKFNDFLLDTVQLPSVCAEIVTEASTYMQGSTLPYQIFLARITNNYSAKAEELIPPEVTKNTAKWQQYLEKSDPKRNCYQISDKQETITKAFAAAEDAIDNCRHYTESLQKNLDAPYQQILTSSGDGRDELAADWNEKMTALQGTCDGWAADLETKLNLVKELNSAKLALAQKQIKVKERWQLTLSIALNLLLVCTVFIFAKLLASAISNAWNLMDAYSELPQRIGFYAINIIAALVAGILSLTNGIVAPTYGNKNRSKLLWLFAIFGVLVYVCVYPGIATGKIVPAVACILALIGIGRTLLEFYLCKLKVHTRSHGTQVSCRIGSTIAKVAGIAQWLVCLGLTALYVCCLLLIL
ncbi:MAG: hypothetical protein IKY18_02125 [Oscillospiraceae bacterium]|nr:hypothetical protein [Oscillospiraceae bacterium]